MSIPRQNGRCNGAPRLEHTASDGVAGRLWSWPADGHVHGMDGHGHGHGHSTGGHGHGHSEDMIEMTRLQPPLCHDHRTPGLPPWGHDRPLPHHGCQHTESHPGHHRQPAHVYVNYASYGESLPTADQRLRHRLDLVPVELGVRCSKAGPPVVTPFDLVTSPESTSDEPPEHTDPDFWTRDKESGASQLRRRHWCAVGMLVLVTAASGLVSVPLVLRDMHSSPQDEHLARARRLLTRVPLVDGHNDFAWNARRFVYNKLNGVNLTTNLRHEHPWSDSVWSHTDLERMRRGMVGAQFWSVYVPCGAQHLDAVQIALEQLDTIVRMTARYPSRTELATSADEIVAIHGGGRLASLIGVEGGHAIADSLPVLRSLYSLGARYLTLTHTCNTAWSEYSEVPAIDQKGLAGIGKQVVREMNRLGMLVDLSHASLQTVRDVLAASRAPVLFSHSAAQALCNISRNVPDAVLRQLALQGGLIMISFYNRFLTCGNTATIDDVIAHIEHVRDIAGVEHVGIGAGYDGINRVPEGLPDASSYPALVARLLARPGWSEQDVSAVVGLNFIRVFRRVEQVRDQLRAEQPVALDRLTPPRPAELTSACTYRGPPYAD